MNPLDECDDAGMTPLMIAVFQRDQEKVRQLLLAGADPSRAIIDGTTPLWRAEDDFGLFEVAAIPREYEATVRSSGE